ncbi:uncharacterized protein LOC111627241 [Centruroides sculpturatus]|uniref:uncharacterized protein LOC111627241 n=1 Tax=Centruroides sculpturatus TaxID=218467 RepID=UPI000C6EB1D3|nr:uncharacterized protein LOC111627241 [Centruroides sculpturatus]
MVIKLDKRKFEKHLVNVLKALDSNAHLIALKGILITALPDQVQMLVSNGNLSIQETIPTDESLQVIQTGKILVPGKLFVQLIKKHSSPLEMKVENKQLVLKSQNFFSNINLLDVSEYPQISFEVSGQEIDVDAKILRETIKNVAFAASNRDTNIILNGVNLLIKDDQLIVSATDTYRIAREIIPIKTNQTFNITILSRHVKDFIPEYAEGLIRLCLKENKIVTSYQTTQVLLKLIDGIYPNVGKVIPSEFTYRLEIETNELINLVEKALVVYKESSSLNSLCFVLKPQELEILGRENEIGHTEVKSNNISWNGPDFRITFNGSYLKEAASRFKVVAKKKLEDLEKIKIGQAVEISGKINSTPGKPQPIELELENFQILTNVDEEFPIQKQGINRETLRKLPHLRHRTNLFRVVMLVRSKLAQEIHRFFWENNFLYLQSPIITANDGEGAGETFLVDSPIHKNFFKRKANLSVTGQLHAEAYATGFQKVYTFAPTFRAELSHTTRHIAEFWMVEPEVAFYNLDQNIALAVQMLKQVVNNTRKQLESEFKWLRENVPNQHLDSLDKLVKEEIPTIDYRQALEKLNKIHQQTGLKKISFGQDLSIEHERALCEKIYQSPVVVINYPKQIKAFYMQLNEDQKTVANFDLLVPGVGELIGGSVREADYQKLTKRLKELKIASQELDWYLDLRRFGGGRSAGFGLGFERLVMYVCGLDNIRDAIPFPRTPGNLRM